jgi:hypothetical protein
MTEAQRSNVVPAQHQAAPPAKERQPLIHPLSAVLLIAIDNLWLLADWAALLWIVTIPVSFLAVFLPSYFIQKFVKGDATGRSLAVAMFLGVVAAVPTSVTGTTVGTVALGFAGLRLFRSKK